MMNNTPFKLDWEYVDDQKNIAYLKVYQIMNFLICHEEKTPVVTERLYRASFIVRNSNRIATNIFLDDNRIEGESIFLDYN